MRVARQHDGDRLADVVHLAERQDGLVLDEGPQVRRGCPQRLCSQNGCDTGERLTTACGREIEIWALDHKEDEAVLSAWASHSRAPLSLTFYDAAPGAVAAFPAAYRGDAFVALHGSWNRSKRTGYKIVRLLLKDGVPSGVYEDFLTGFVIDDNNVWGRPVGIAVAHDGALLVSEDGNGTIWRVSYRGW